MPETTSHSLATRLVRFASSPRVATALIATIGVLSVVGMVYPQRSVMSAEQLADWHRSAAVISRVGEALGLDHLFTTWYFIALLLTLVLVTAVCTTRRVARRRTPSGVPSAHSRRWPTTRVEDGAADPAAVIAVVAGRISHMPSTVSVRSESEDGPGWRALLSAGRVGFWGSIVYHLAIIIIAAGAVFSALTTFNGRAVVTEGQEFVDEPRSYYRVSEEPRIGTGYGGGGFVLDRLDFDYAGDLLTRSVATVVVREAPNATPRRLTAEVNYPIEAGGKSYLLGNSGYSVALRTGAAGGVMESYYALGQREPGGYSDTVDLPGGVTAEIYALPRQGGAIDREVPRRYQLDDPRVHVRLVATGRTLWEGDLARGQEIDAQGYRLSLVDVRLWNEFLVRGDRGRLAVYVGLWLVVAGLAVRFADPERRVLIIRDGDVLTVSAYHRYGAASSRALLARVSQAKWNTVPPGGQPDDREEGT